MYYIGGRYAHSFKGVGYSNVGSWLTSVVVISFRKFGTESIGTAMLDDGPYFKILVEESSGRGCRSGADAAMHVQLPISILKQKFYFFFFYSIFLKKINQKIYLYYDIIHYSLFIFILIFFITNFTIITILLPQVSSPPQTTLYQ